jgi:hypothetical protein
VFLIISIVTLIIFINTFTASQKKEAFTEALGRAAGWLSLLFKKPKIIK